MRVRLPEGHASHELPISRSSYLLPNLQLSHSHLTPAVLVTYSCVLTLDVCVYVRIVYIHRYTIAAAFGNVHGVYKAGNVKLSPEILGKAQKYVKDQLKCKEVSSLCVSLFSRRG